MKRAGKKRKNKERSVRRDPNKHYLINGAKLDEIKDEMADEATKKAVMLILGELSCMGWTEEQILDLFDRFCRSDTNAKNGVLPCEDVQAIVEKHTGMKFECRWY